MSTPDWREAHDAGRDSGYAAGRAEAGAELTSLRARVAEPETVLRALRDAAEASDDSLYGTLGTGFVRSVVDGALGLSPSDTAQHFSTKETSDGRAED